MSRLVMSAVLVLLCAAWAQAASVSLPQTQDYTATPKHVSPDSEVLYHTGLSHKSLEGATLALLPGDPGRVADMARDITDPGTQAKPLAAHREYTSWLAWVGGKPVLICSTGMGGPSVAIGLEELSRIGIKQVIRFGTTGSIQKNIHLGDVVINNAAVRLDGTSHHYAPAPFPAVANFTMTSALQRAAEAKKVPYHLGISVSSDTFWPGQERYDSVTGYVPRHFQGTLKEWQALGAINYEMETSTLFVVSHTLGLKAGAICAVVAQRTESESIASNEVYKKGYARMIEVTREAILQLL